MISEESLSHMSTDSALTNSPFKIEPIKLLHSSWYGEVESEAVMYGDEMSSTSKIINVSNDKSVYSTAQVIVYKMKT